MPKTELFEKHSDRYDERFEKNRDIYDVELAVIRQLIPSRQAKRLEMGVAQHRRKNIKHDGTWMIVEPLAGDRVEDNFNPVGRLFYCASVLLCTSGAIAQEGQMVLGGQAGEARIREVVTAGEFTRFRRAVQTPINLVFEARP
jgi:hypothetical protein